MFLKKYFSNLYQIPEPCGLNTLQMSTIDKIKSLENLVKDKPSNITVEELQKK